MSLASCFILTNITELLVLKLKTLVNLQDNVSLWISELARLEFVSALHQRLRMDELS